MAAPGHFQSLPLALSQKPAWLLSHQLTSLSAGKRLQDLPPGPALEFWRVWLECTSLMGGAGLHLSYGPPLFPLGLQIKGGPLGSSRGHSPFIPLPSSWNVLRAVVWSSKCSLPPLPEEATLLCGDRGAWSDGRHWGPLARKSSWDIHPCPRGWFGTFMGGVRDTDRFKGLWCAWPERTGKKNKMK